MRIVLRERSILAIGFALFLIWSFPGFMSTDSQNQLMEARSGKFSDAHPPLMSAIWRLLDAFVSGPVLMLLLQGGLFLGGLYVIFKRFLPERRAAIFASAVLLYPPVLTVMGVIWKDSQMAAYLIAGTAALLSPRLRIRLLGLGFLVVACAIRHNAFAAVVPLVFFVFEWRAGMGWWKRTMIAVGAAVLAVVAMFAITKFLTVQPIKLTPAFQDIVGVIAFSDEKSDAELLEILKGLELGTDKGIQARCRSLYEQRGAWRITQADDRLMNYPATPAQWDALSRAWKTLVLQEPGAYFAYHWDTFRRVIGVDAVPRSPIYNLFVEFDVAVDELDHNAGYSTTQAYLSKAFYALAETPLFRPWLYMVLALVLLALFVRDRLTAGLIVSGLLYELSYFPVGADPDFRYSHWMIASVTLATVLLVVQRMHKREAPP
ncbi:MAG: hypothetical protein M4D80_16310 [Myxococcota bacterium]|nr:hypothetical protein [Myxococcota bacterium]